MDEINKKQEAGHDIAQIRFEFTDGTWFILDQHSFRHIDTGLMLEVNFALTKIYEVIEAKRKEAEENKGLEGLGINVKEDINTKDKLV